MWWKNQKSIVGTKISCFALPALQLGVLRLNILARNDFAQLIVMDSISKHSPYCSNVIATGRLDFSNFFKFIIIGTE